MDLYHADIRLPNGYALPDRRVSLNWTRHADRARTTDRYAPEIPRFETIPLSSFRTVEVGVEGSKVVKVVIRGKWTANYDVVFVLIPNGTRPWTVKTVWINERNDSHATLDRSKYVA